MEWDRFGSKDFRMEFRGWKEVDLVEFSVYVRKKRQMSGKSDICPEKATYGQKKSTMGRRYLRTEKCLPI